MNSSKLNPKTLNILEFLTKCDLSSWTPEDLVHLRENIDKIPKSSTIERRGVLDILFYNRGETLRKEFSQTKTIRNVLYWLYQGLTIDEAKAKLKNTQTIDLDYFVKKFGPKDGWKRYYRKVRKGKSTNANKSIEEKAQINAKKSNPQKGGKFNDRSSLQYCQERYGEEKGLIKFQEKSKKTDSSSKKSFIKKYGWEEGLRLYEYKRLRCIQSEENYIKWYGEDGIVIFQDKQDRRKETLENKTQDEKDLMNLKKSFSVEGYMARGFDFNLATQLYNERIKAKQSKTFSNISQKLFVKLEKILDSRGYRTNCFYESKNFEKVFLGLKLDFYEASTNTAIEFYGDYWHCNPNAYKGPEVIEAAWNRYTASEKWEIDRKRINRLTKYLNTNIIIIWESEYKDSPNEVLDRLSNLIGEKMNNLKQIKDELVYQNVSVDQLRNLYMSNDYDIEIETPDGYQKITNWFDKGSLLINKITLENGYVTECAYNHLVEEFSNNSYKWTLAKDVTDGMFLLTDNGLKKVLSNEQLDSRPCFDFTVDHDNHRYFGDKISSHNSGKSFLASGNMVRDAQSKGVFVVLFDTENALDENWLHRLDVDTSPEKLLKINISMVNEVAKFTNDFVDGYKEEFGELPLAERPKILLVIDSIGMLLTPTNVAQFADGDLKGDMGIKAKQITALLRNIVSMISSENIGLAVTNHTYASQDQFSPDSVISGGAMLEYASSVIIAMEKRKLKEDEDGNKGSEVHGIRCAVQVRKSRYNKPFEKLEIQIPYLTGMNRHSGLFDLFEKKGLLKKIGNRYQYTALDGTEILEFRKRYTPEIFMRIMQEFHEHPVVKKTGVIADEVEVTEDE